MFLGTFLMADTDSDINGAGTGTVPFNASWENTPTNADFSTMNIAAYDNNSLDFASVIAITDFDANYAFNITATNTGWSALPSGYAGNKTAAGSDNDLLIKIDDINNDNHSGSTGLSAANGYGSFTAITNSGAVVASGGSSTNGVEDVLFNVDARVLLDWVNDVKGTYTVGITLTVSSQ